MYIIYKIYILQNMYKHMHIFTYSKWDGVYIYIYIYHGEGHGNHSSILAWRIPWTEDPGELESIESQRFGHNWVINTLTHVCVCVCVCVCSLTGTPKLCTFRDANVSSHVQSHVSLHVWHTLSILCNLLLFCVYHCTLLCGVQQCRIFISGEGWAEATIKATVI